MQIIGTGHRSVSITITSVVPDGRAAAAGDPGRIRFSPAILPPYVRRSKRLEMLIPILYLKGISTGDFEEALAALLGKDAAGLSASTIGAAEGGLVDEHARWSKRDLSAKRYVYFWADGIHLQARLEDDAQCILVIIGATPEGKKELVGFTDGARESAQDWRDLLLDLKRRGLDVPPELAVADGALGFWKALGEVWPKTREQRCWVHKTANVLEQAAEEPAAEGQARLAGDLDGRNQEGCRRGVRRLHRELRASNTTRRPSVSSKDRDALLAFYDFPAEHWKHLRTTNPIESTFATVRHRTIRSKGCLSNKTALAMVFKLRRGRAEKLAPPRWPQPVAKTHPRCESSPTGSRSSPSRPTVSPNRRRLTPGRHQNSAIAHVLGDAKRCQANPDTDRRPLQWHWGGYNGESETVRID